jgi:hypothetical protein
MKERIQKDYGTLRMAAVKTGINYYRLSQIVNGWVTPTQEEISILKITPKEIKDVIKK